MLNKRIMDKIKSFFLKVSTHSKNSIVAETEVLTLYVLFNGLTPGPMLVVSAWDAQGWKVVHRKRCAFIQNEIIFRARAVNLQAPSYILVLY